MALLILLLQEVMAFCRAHGVSAWLVGGALRDALMGRAAVDIDMALAGDGLRLARMLADQTGGSFVPLDEERGAGRVVYPPGSFSDQTEHALVLDMVGLRAPTIEEDLRLRDFTINAVALPLDSLSTTTDIVAEVQGRAPLFAHIIDPCGGVDDCYGQRLRVCYPDAFLDDPVRMLRAIRLVAQCSWELPQDIETLINKQASQITTVAMERVRDELFKLLSLPDASRWLRILDQLGLLTHIMPELEAARTCDQPVVHFLPVLDHLFETVTSIEWLLDGLAPDVPAGPDALLPVAVQTYPDLPRTLPHQSRLWEHLTTELAAGYPRMTLLKLAALLHDNAKPQTKQMKPDGRVSFYGHQHIGANVARTLTQRLALPRMATSYVRLIIYHHMRPGQLRSDPLATERAFARLYHDTIPHTPDVILHALADHLAVRGPMIEPDDWQHHLDWSAAQLSNYWAEPTSKVPNVPLVHGHDLIDVLHLSPGVLVGRLLREIADAQRAGEVQTREEALQLAEQLLTTFQQETS